MVILCRKRDNQQVNLPKQKREKAETFSLSSHPHNSFYCVHPEIWQIVTTKLVENFIWR